VNHYIETHRKGAKDELAFYQNQPTLKQAIKLAALSEMLDGERHGHQRRIPQQALKRLASVLTSHEDHIKECLDFDELHKRIDDVSKDIEHIGPLTVYDVAQRIGAKLNRYPQKIYLHAGTKEGAKILLKKRRIGQSILPTVLPMAFAKLEPYEIEDCLCLYRDWFLIIKEK
jgi:hypothetical protein